MLFAEICKALVFVCKILFVLEKVNSCGIDYHCGSFAKRAQDLFQVVQIVLSHCVYIKVVYSHHHTFSHKRQSFASVCKHWKIKIFAVKLMKVHDLSVSRAKLVHKPFCKAFKCRCIMSVKIIKAVDIILSYRFTKSRSRKQSHSPSSLSANFSYLSSMGILHLLCQGFCCLW